MALNLNNALTNFRDLKLARPSNVIHVNNVSNQFTLKSEHSATFPEGLVEFFVKSFTNEGDVVLDCFAGSGTTGLVCIDSGGSEDEYLLQNSKGEIWRMFHLNFKNLGGDYNERKWSAGYYDEKGNRLGDVVVE